MNGHPSLQFSLLHLSQLEWFVFAGGVAASIVLPLVGWISAKNEKTA